MTGADRRAQALGYPEERLMEHAGTAVAAAVRALAADLDRWGTGPIVILCGPGNNGGDGYVVARRLALPGRTSSSRVVALGHPPDGARRRPELGPASPATRGSRRSTLPVARDVAMFGRGIDKAAVLVDALLGTGVRGAAARPDPIGGRAHRQGPGGRRPGRRGRHPDRGRPVERRAVGPRRPRRPDRHVPSAEDGAARPGAAPRTPGKVLVAPIGIPPEADRG